MQNASLVSIIIPVYNGSNYLRLAIDSALDQTYPATEIIVVDDGSNDEGRTQAIAMSYGQRIKYVRKENGGVATALNRGIQELQGDWFAWLSHDDLFAPDRIEQDMILARENPQAKVFFSRIRIIDAEGRFVREVQYPLDRVTNPREALRLGGVDMCSMTIHKTCFERTGRFNERNRTNQDVEMSLRLAAAFPFIYSRRAVTFKRIHPASGTSTQRDEVRRDTALLMDVIHDELSLKAFFPSLGDDPDQVAEAWIWMGDFYRSFGALHYADESFVNALDVGSQWERTVRIKARRLNRPWINRLLNLGARVNRLLKRGSALC
jgi:glycosyltransferase involved in cell wall biosynthesis